MGQPISIVLNEQEYAELQRRAEAEKRTLGEVAHTMLDEHLTPLPEPLPEGFLPYGRMETGGSREVGSHHGATD